MFSFIPSPSRVHHTNDQLPFWQTGNAVSTPDEVSPWTRSSMKYFGGQFLSSKCFFVPLTLLVILTLTVWWLGIITIHVHWIFTLVSKNWYYQKVEEFQVHFAIPCNQPIVQSLNLVSLIEMRKIIEGPNLKIEVILVNVRGKVSANLLWRHF